MKLLRFPTGLVSLLAVLAVLAALPASAAKLRLLTTIPPVYCFVANVAGDRAVVENLLPPGSDAHDFQFTFASRRKLENADLIFVNGLGLEAWLKRAIESAGTNRLVRVADGMESQWIPPGSAEPNPHVWLDPQLACRMVTNILVALRSADPDNAHAYASNAAAYATRLLKLDAEIRLQLEDLPNRAIVTAHDGFPYLSRRYDLKVVGVLEQTSGIDPSLARLKALRAEMQKQNVKALFADTHMSARRARQLGRDFEVAVGVLDTLESAPLTPASYEDGMRRNMRVLRETIR